MPSKVLLLVHTTVVVAILRSTAPSLDMEVDMEDTRSRVDITSSNRLADKVEEVWGLLALLLWVLVAVYLAVC